MSLNSFLNKERVPSSMIVLLSCSFLRARWNMTSSTVNRVINRITVTSFSWPILCTRASACRSAWGFQSLSMKITVSAALIKKILTSAQFSLVLLFTVKLRPRPPALVLNKNTNGRSSSAISSSFAWKFSMARYRSSPLTDPSNRS